MVFSNSCILLIVLFYFYFSIGVPLVALNPFRNVTELYDDEVVEKYKRGSSCLAKVQNLIFLSIEDLKQKKLGWM